MSFRSVIPRLGLTVGLGLACALVTWSTRAALNAADQLPSDFAQLWYAAGAWRDGANPYDVVGPGKPFPWPFPLLYPLPAVIVAWPFSFLPLPWAEALFVGLGTAALAWAVTRSDIRTPVLCVFASLAMLRVCTTAQWAPLLTAAGVLPLLGFLLACKPTIGLAMFVAYPSRWTIVGAGAFGALATMLWPWWVRDWLAAVSTITHMQAPILGWGGPLIALAATRWRRAEARLLLALACMPQTPVIYEAVPLFLIARTLEEGVAVAVLTVVWQTLLSAVNPPTQETWFAVGGQLMVATLYLPCLLMVLRRPNVSTDNRHHMKTASLWTGGHHLPGASSTSRP